MNCLLSLNLLVEYLYHQLTEKTPAEVQDREPLLEASYEIRCLMESIMLFTTYFFSACSDLNLVVFSYETILISPLVRDKDYTSIGDIQLETPFARIEMQAKG